MGRGYRLRRYAARAAYAPCAYGRLGPRYRCAIRAASATRRGRPLRESLLIPAGGVRYAYPPPVIHTATSSRQRMRPSGATDLYGGFQPPEDAPFGCDGFIRRLHLRSLTIHELEKLRYAYAQPVRRIFDRKQLIVDESN